MRHDVARHATRATLLLVGFAFAWAAVESLYPGVCRAADAHPPGAVAGLLTTVGATVDEILPDPPPDRPEPPEWTRRAEAASTPPVERPVRLLAATRPPVASAQRPAAAPAPVRAVTDTPGAVAETVDRRLGKAVQPVLKLPVVDGLVTTLTASTTLRVPVGNLCQLIQIPPLTPQGLAVRLLTPAVASTPTPPGVAHDRFTDTFVRPAATRSALPVDRIAAHGTSTAVRAGEGHDVAVPPDPRAPHFPVGKKDPRLVLPLMDCEAVGGSLPIPDEGKLCPRPRTTDGETRWRPLPDERPA